MSAESINKKIRKAYGKVGKILGSDFEIFRPETLFNQTSVLNFLDVKPVAFALDEKFKKTFSSDKIPLYTAYVDGLLEELFDIEQGDILYSEELSETYIITLVETHKPIMAFKCNKTISVGTTTYSNPGSGFIGGNTEVADLIPCYFDIKSYSGSDLGFIPGGNYGTDPYSTGEIMMSDPSDQVLIGSTITESNTIWTVMSVEYTPLGKKVMVELQK